MSDGPYSNRELDLKFGSLHEKLDNIIALAKYTNGKVRRITVILVALGFFTVGLGISQLSIFLPFIMALI